MVLVVVVVLALACVGALGAMVRHRNPTLSRTITRLFKRSHYID